MPASLLEQVEKHESDYAIALELLTEFKLIVDSSEQPRSRPSDNQAQKEYFSGKKKQHTFKNKLITLPKGKDIIDVEVAKKGPSSDIINPANKNNASRFKRAATPTSILHFGSALFLKPP